MLKVPSLAYSFNSDLFFELGKISYKMTAFWRQVGLNYINYSSICARALRSALKEPFKTQALGRDGSLVKTSKWEAGKVTKVVRSDGSLIKTSKWEAGKVTKVVR